MKAVTYQKSQDTFTLTELPEPQIQSPFDVLVKVHSVGLNPVDAKVHLWQGMVADMDDNFVGGLDVSGEIVATGDAVTDWNVGDMVLYHGDMRREHGGFAEYAIQDSRSLIAHPSISTDIAAATPCAAWTAYRALVDKLNISTRKSIFISGGSGGVGSFAIQMARHFGVQTIIASCSAANHDFVRSLGATHVIDYRSEDVTERVMEITGQQGVDVALECVGGDNDVIAASVLGYEGEMVELVKTVEPALYDNAFLKGLSFHQLSLGSGHVNGEAGRKTLVESGSEVSKLLVCCEVVVPELKVISLEEIGDALIDMRNQRTVGKVVARIID
ncbi:zinc-binding dehydrogenase [Vibrio sp. JC009]|uniref:zinc-binding dehydrogenase n=1 Tax=Vibrio sp. JC009 TaxID=2912314 RepID=UPI0023AE9281|nr:zinc-binding dehydrogenase [Vibrio sp. JC009]WED23646.1 zinc-binding dehydrogenase [Vibrio sp. JC009]